MSVRSKSNSGMPVAAARTMVRLTLAAALLAPAARTARAQSVQCVNNVRFGNFVPCGAGGSITVTPAGLTNIKGCIVTFTAALPGSCKISAFPTTNTVTISVTANTDNIAAGGNTMVVDGFNVVTKSAGKNYFMPQTAITATPVKFGIGARLRAPGGQISGSYSGNVTLRVTFTN